MESISMTLRGASIIGTGMYVPERVVTNFDLEAIMDTDDAWIQQRSGIVERRHVDAGVGTSDLATEAALRAIEAAGIAASDLDMIIVATFTSDHFFPGASAMVQHKLGLDTTPAMDVKCQCTGFLFALKTAHAFIASGQYERVLVIGAEVHSNGLSFTDSGRDTAVLFGDGAGALILEATDDPSSGILDVQLFTQGEHMKRLWMDAPGMLYNPMISKEMIDEGRHFPTMDGRFVFKHAVTRMPQALLGVLGDQNLSPDDVDLFLFHQANLRINEFVAQRLKVAPERVFNNIQKYGNTSAATLPICLDECVRSGRVKKGDLITMTGFGSGFTWGSAVLRL
jgi:3-oxoacyl-[acyl-carrier-protein] synthase-3